MDARRREPRADSNLAGELTASAGKRAAKPFAVWMQPFRAAPIRRAKHALNLSDCTEVTGYELRPLP
jgi:hypothetical protein